MLGLKGAGEELGCDTMLGSPGQGSGKGSQRTGTSQICAVYLSDTNPKVRNRTE